MFFFWKRWFFKRHRWKPWPVGKKHAKSVAFFFRCGLFVFLLGPFRNGFFWHSNNWVVPRSVFFFPAKLGRW